MKHVKQIVCLVLVVALCLALTVTFASCGKKKYTVGILQLVTHDALDAATKGFQDALIARLGEENVAFDLQNAQGESANCTTIANSFVTKKVDLIMANATPALQAAANATTTIPILGTSVTDYGSALGRTDITDLVGGNVSGTSDLAPLEEQAKMILELFPGATKVGMLYCSAEANSAFQVSKVSAYLADKGVTCTNFAFSDSNDVAAVTQRAAAESEVIYIPTDNTAASCVSTIDPILTAARVPVVAGEEAICKGCGVATLSISYYSLGYKTGEMAADILEGKADIATMKIAYDPKEPVKKYVASRCTAIGVTVPTTYVAIEETAN